MNTALKAFLSIAILTITAATTQAAVRPHPTTIIVESPETFPVLAQPDAEAMYLHDTTDGRTFLYVEAWGGQELTALDVTDPARIQCAGHAPISATSAFDFVQPVGNEGALIQYRNGSGVALLSFKHYKHPRLVNSRGLEKTETLEALGQTGLLLTSTVVASHPISDSRNYKVVDTANVWQPELLAMIPAVKECLSKSDTGTLFLLNKDGITVVRRPRVEEEHQIDLLQQSGN